MLIKPVSVNPKYALAPHLAYSDDSSLTRNKKFERVISDKTTQNTQNHHQKKRKTAEINIYCVSYCTDMNFFNRISYQTQESISKISVKLF